MTNEYLVGDLQAAARHRLRMIRKSRRLQAKMGRKINRLHRKLDVITREINATEAMFRAVPWPFDAPE